MRLSRVSLCLLPLMLAACSTVKVTSHGPGAEAEHAPVRSDQAPTDAFPAADNDGYRPPARVAVILPMGGSLAAPAAGVRDGFLSAYYGETRRRPIVKFYDSQGTGAGALAAVAKARADGAQMIIGPLTRDEVNAVAGSADGSFPIIALNRGAAAAPKGTTSFALTPDEEGAAASNRLFERGLKHALVFSNGSDNATRAVAAFRDTLGKRGGSVVEVISISGETANLSARLAALRSGPTPPQAVLLALDAGQGRAICAQLRGSALSDLPRLATSQILSGASAKSDVELDGVEYPELPWLLDQDVGLPEADALAHSLPSARGPSQRLFAFGADAWKLCAWFDLLYNQPGASIAGATGRLSIDVSGPVKRAPAWAVFVGGRGRTAAAAHGPPATR
jgi:outer membrane PBP1 activator LpoA protein